jgi:HSP20 family protein
MKPKAIESEPDSQAQVVGQNGNTRLNRRKGVVKMAVVRWKPITRWDPFDELMDIQRGLNRIFSRGVDQDMERGERAWAPVVDVYEDEDSVVVKAELPGVSEKDIEISVDDSTLMIRGERKTEEEFKEENYHRIERAYGSFQRVLSLPTSVDTEKVEAMYENGVLQITCPKHEGVKPRKIEVKAGK